MPYDTHMAHTVAPNPKIDAIMTAILWNKVNPVGMKATNSGPRKVGAGLGSPSDAFLQDDARIDRLRRSTELVGRTFSAEGGR